jgi:ferredoxin, 2Fe-2S
MKIIVANDGGETRELDAVEGWRVMEIIRANGVSLGAECGGASVCGECRVRVDPKWQDRLHDPREDELERLDEHFAGEDERLSCQLIFSEELNGLTLRLPDAA